MKKRKITSQLPPLSKNLLADIFHYLLHSPKHDTFIKFDNPMDKKYYGLRILHRLNVRVNEYKVLNIHKIGINAPGKNVFEELLAWDTSSLYWPNHIARIKHIDENLSRVQIYLFGKEKIFVSKLLKLSGLQLPQLFKLEKRQFNLIPQTKDLNNEHSLLYDCSGGYPIGIFSLYVRSSNENQNEKEMSQLFFMVAFDFFGLKKDHHFKLIKKIWEAIHNRVTANVLNRIKLICESNYDSISAS